MIGSQVQINTLALREALRSEESRQYFAAVGREVRDRARATAKTVVPPSDDASNPTAAIISVPGEDDEGVYADVGYSKNHPGFYLWWWEVGTVNHAARPHLRPALRPHG